MIVKDTLKGETTKQNAVYDKHIKTETLKLLNLAASSTTTDVTIEQTYNSNIHKHCLKQYFSNALRTVSQEGKNRKNSNGRIPSAQHLLIRLKLIL